MNVNVLDLYTKDSGVVNYTEGAAELSIVAPDHEEGFCLLVKNTSASPVTVTVKEGNSIYAMGDMAVSVNGSEDAVINLKNTGRFKNVNGENSGKIIINISEPENVKVSAVSL